MKKLLFLIILPLISVPATQAQKYFTKSGKINFDATSPSSPERIEAVNRTATCVLDAASGAIQFSVLMKGFEFERALMQEHFNENYVESSAYPRSEFKGQVVNNAEVNYGKDGTYSVKVRGKLTMHGVTKDIETDGKLTVQSGKIVAAATFSALLSDYNISIPGLVADKVAKTAKIIVNCNLDPLKTN